MCYILYYLSTLFYIFDIVYLILEQIQPEYRSYSKELYK